MIILKHVGHKIKDSAELNNLLKHLKETTSKVTGVLLKDVYFPMDKDEFILFLDCISEDRYLEWREICPPPSGATDWYEILFTKDEQFG